MSSVGRVSSGPVGRGRRGGVVRGGRRPGARGWGIVASAFSERRSPPDEMGAPLGQGIDLISDDVWVPTADCTSV